MPYEDVPDERMAAFLFLGPVDGAVTSDDADVASGDGFEGYTAAAGPDADGDGTPELYLGRGRGGIDRFDGVPTSLSEDAADGTLRIIESLVYDAGGDVDGDGTPELAVVHRGGLSIYPAGFVGSVDDSAMLAEAPLSMDSADLVDLASLGDADGDGRDDYVAGFPSGLDGETWLPIVCLVPGSAL